MRPLGITLTVLTAALLSSNTATAQSRYGGANAYLRPAARRPLISPYLTLLQQSGIGVSNYYTQVRPQLRQRSFNLQQTANIQRLQQQVAGAAASRQAGTQGIRDTGHFTTFRNFSHYFPARQQSRQKRR